MTEQLFEEGYTQNRELSWLRFDDRVLAEAEDKNVPLLERMKSVYFYTSNLTEFFRVRAGSLYDLAKAKYPHVDAKSGMTPSAQLSAVYPAAHRGCRKRDEIYADLRKKLAKEGIEDLDIRDCTKEEMKFLKKYFKTTVYPLLAPQVVDAHHPFPNLQSGTIYVAAVVNYKGHGSFSFVPVPSSLPAVIVLPHKKKFRFIHTEDLIVHFLSMVYPDAGIDEAVKISVARSAYVDPMDEAFDDIGDYRKKMLKVLKQRRKMNVTMLTCSQQPSAAFRKYLLNHLKIKERALFVCTAPMNLKYVFSLEKMLPEGMQGRYSYEPFEPKLSPAFNYEKPLFDQIQKKDVMLFYPYESMEPFLRLVKEASEDPDTVSIKITIYRLASNARLVNYLCAAAENGKEVDVLIELKARFDEQNNIDYSERLEDAGCNVNYGFDAYKVHSKICLITRIKDGRSSAVTLVSTGNFNENTASSYTDIAVMTARKAIVSDAVEFFRNMAIGKLDGTYKQLLVAPVSLKSTLIELIGRETAKGSEGRIFAKINAVTDEDIIRALKEASCAGVKIQLVVRGISCILPGIPGKTENIEIRSIVGRFLEHSRIYIFGSGADEKMYIGSADFMTRNTERRVEIACPVLDKKLQARVHEMVDIIMQDNEKARIMSSAGRYRKFKNAEVPFDEQKALMRMMPESRKGIPAVQNRAKTAVFHTKYKQKKND